MGEPTCSICRDDAFAIDDLIDPTWWNIHGATGINEFPDNSLFTLENYLLFLRK